METLTFFGLIILIIIAILSPIFIENYSGPRLRSEIGDIYIKHKSKTKKGRDELFKNK